MRFLVLFFLLITMPLLATEKKPSLSIEENLHGGTILKLSDGTEWQIAPESVAISQTWLIPTPLKIEKIDRKDYSHKITNISAKNFVLAKPKK